MPTLVVSEALARLIAEWAAKTGRKPNEFAIEAIEEHIADLRDLEVAERRTAQQGPRTSLSDVERKLGLGG